MQIIFYTLDKENSKLNEIAKTPISADSIYRPIPRVDELVTLDQIRHTRRTFRVTNVEHVYADVLSDVTLYYVKVILTNE
jgi:hypothetical protein